jgi:hypothetical protein
MTKVDLNIDEGVRRLLAEDARVLAAPRLPVRMGALHRGHDFGRDVHGAGRDRAATRALPVLSAGDRRQRAGEARTAVRGDGAGQDERHGERRRRPFRHARAQPSDGSLLSGILSHIPPPAAVTDAAHPPLTLRFDDNSMSDVWLAITWGK